MDDFSAINREQKKRAAIKDCAKKVTVHVAPSTTGATLAAYRGNVITVKYFIF